MKATRRSLGLLLLALFRQVHAGPWLSGFWFSPSTSAHKAPFSDPLILAHIFPFPPSIRASIPPGRRAKCFDDELANASADPHVDRAR